VLHRERAVALAGDGFRGRRLLDRRKFVGAQRQRETGQSFGKLVAPARTDQRHDVEPA
jgi:hypothetical protein